MEIQILIPIQYMIEDRIQKEKMKNHRFGGPSGPGRTQIYDMNLIPQPLESVVKNAIICSNP